MAKRSKSVSVAPVAILPGMTAEQTAETLNVGASAPSVAPVAPTPPPVADPVAPVAPVPSDSVADPAPTPPAPDSAPVPSDSAPVAPSVPTPPTPPAPPCVAVSPPVADPVKPDALLTPKAQSLCVALITFIGNALNVGTERMALWGERIRDIVLAEMNATEGWDSKTFDSTMSNIATEFARANPDALPLRSADAWKVAEFRRHCVALGIPNVDAISATRITGGLFAGIEMVKTQSTSNVRDGWADWLKHVVPVVARGEMNLPTIVASLDLQRAALNASDPKRYPLKGKTGAAARKETTGSGRKAPKAPPVKPGPKPAPAPVAPVKPAPAPSVAPVAPVAPVANIPDVATFANGLTLASATTLGNLLLTHPSDDVVKAIYKAIAPRLKMIQAKENASKASA